ncbi:unnamed protein product [Somion occarium]|uniref:Uncharacterized protein n=1 Tax=Somion occarium TaxID=3059160 RepID=A0ABP1CLC6_9APHY
MATLTITATAYNHSSKPPISSPLASNAPTRLPPKRPLSNGHAFPTSRPLRPFPSINTSFSSNGPKSKPTKIIEPPKNFRGEWVLNLTQAEFRRQD